MILLFYFYNWLIFINCLELALIYQNVINHYFIFCAFLLE